MIDLQANANDQAPGATDSANISNDGSRYASGETKYNYGSGDVRITSREIKLGYSPQPGPAERGEVHFFDARLSAGSWYSCHSCHTDGHTSGELADTLGDGREGAPKRILSLLGVAETGPWSWLGTKPRLYDQVHRSLQSTMLGRQLKRSEIEDLVAYLTTLKPPPPLEPPVTDEDRALVAEGRALFESLNCTSCHEGRVLTSGDAYDVGLTDEFGVREFNPPSLRGVGHRHRLFHDNRAASLEQVVRGHKHQLPRPLTGDQQQALIRYLKSL